MSTTYGARYATYLVKRTALADGIAVLARKPVLNGDNGSTLKATTVHLRRPGRTATSTTS
jgi:hypothetical protein